jgi:hypothetical protein
MRESSNCAFRLVPLATAVSIVLGTVTLAVEQPGKAADQPHGEQQDSRDNALQTRLGQSIRSSTSGGVTARPGTGRLVWTGYSPVVSVRTYT